jgi:NAD(P)-dependent dehydrogenase (short-subunit alcohol dehydrogenase family)
VAVVRRLVAEGARVAVWDSSVAVAAQPTQNTLVLPADVSDAASIAVALAGTLKAFDRIDILVTSGGITGPNATVADYPVDA